jgi:hypothetical protein
LTVCYRLILLFAEFCRTARLLDNPDMVEPEAFGQFGSEFFVYIFCYRFSRRVILLKIVNTVQRGVIKTSYNIVDHHFELVKVHNKSHFVKLVAVNFGGNCPVMMVQRLF